MKILLGHPVPLHTDRWDTNRSNKEKPAQRSKHASAEGNARLEAGQKIQIGQSFYSLEVIPIIVFELPPSPSRVVEDQPLSTLGGSWVTA